MLFWIMHGIMLKYLLPNYQYINIQFRKCLTNVLKLQMGIADAILDFVSSGTTLQENNLKELEGGLVLESQVFLSLSRLS